MDPGIALFTSFAILSLICSLLTVYLIYQMKRWNAYLKLIVCLTLAQTLYDVSVIMAVDSDPNFNPYYICLRGITGLATTLWTNVLAIIIAYVIFFLKTVDLAVSFWAIFGLVMIPSITVGIAQVTTTGDYRFAAEEAYYWGRLVSIVFNIVIYIAVSWKTHTRKRAYSRSNPHISSTARDPIEELVYRLQYYPVVQVLCRVFVACKEKIYGYSYNYDPNALIGNTALLYISAITQPSAGIGFFIIFLAVSPGAKDFFLKLLWPLSSCMSSHTGNNNCESSPDHIQSNYRQLITGDEEETDGDTIQGYFNSVSTTGSHQQQLLQHLRRDYTDLDEHQLSEEILRLYRFELSEQYHSDSLNHQQSLEGFNEVTL